MAIPQKYSATHGHELVVFALIEGLGRIDLLFKYSRDEDCMFGVFVITHVDTPATVYYDINSLIKMMYPHLQDPNIRQIGQNIIQSLEFHIERVEKANQTRDYATLKKLCEIPGDGSVEQWARDKHHPYSRWVADHTSRIKRKMFKVRSAVDWATRWYTTLQQQCTCNHNFAPVVAPRVFAVTAGEYGNTAQRVPEWIADKCRVWLGKLQEENRLYRPRNPDALVNVDGLLQQMRVAQPVDLLM